LVDEVGWCICIASDTATAFGREIYFTVSSFLAIAKILTRVCDWFEMERRKEMKSSGVNLLFCRVEEVTKEGSKRRGK
jgi:hypothetical protein